MGWTDTHLYEFRSRDIGWGIPDPDWSDGPLDARKTTLLDAIEDTGGRTLSYIYDFGDGWEHTIRIEHIDAAEPGVIYPRLLDAIGRCPPEDVGGPPGYEQFLAAIADPDHKQHAELREWVGDAFDPHVVDIDGIAETLTKLGKRWRRRSRSSKKPANK